MMGQHAHSESLFYYFRLEDQIPENHLLRLVDKHIDFGFVRERLKESYSDTGRPSIAPGTAAADYADWLSVWHQQRAQACGGTAHASAMALVHRSRFRPGGSASLHVFKEPPRALSGIEPVRADVREVVVRCMSVGRVRGDKLSLDGPFVEANASKESRIPREQLAEAAQINRTVREYLAELEMQNPVEEPTHSQDKVSTTDPDSTMRRKVARRHAWDTTTTTWLIITAVSLWACRRQALA
jgi:hypothetical protein